MGENIPVHEAEDYIFGMVLLNDWSARHPEMGVCSARAFLAKNFASSISPWIVTMDALEPFRTKGPNKILRHCPICSRKANTPSISV
jgi:fumarylacetoacetase